MRLLILTQTLDRNDSYLSFFTSWVDAFAAKTDNLTIICLQRGDYVPPSGVRVLSLGKESGTSRLGRLVRLFVYAWRTRNEYDAVFVHMNQEYVLLVGWLWRYLGKRVYLWRNHYAGSSLTAQAAKKCVKVFYTSSSSYTARFRNAVQMPVGVDLEACIRDFSVERDPRAILFLGRLAPSKRPELFLQALGILSKRGVNFSASLCGEPLSPAYLTSLQQAAEELGIAKSLRFLPSVPHQEVPKLFSKNTIFVNSSPSGMYDKTIFEAANCECIVVASSKDFAALVPARFAFEDNNAEDLARKLEHLLELPLIDQQGAGVQMRHVAKEHDLKLLIGRLLQEMEGGATLENR